MSDIIERLTSALLTAREYVVDGVNIADRELQEVANYPRIADRRKYVLDQSKSDLDEVDAALAAARLRTELEAAKGDAVGVKALEWEHHPQATGQVRAPSAIGTYRIVHFGDYALWGRLPERLTEKAETIEEAKAAAQADFERRIRSALTADKSEAEVRQQEQIREDTLDGLYRKANADYIAAEARGDRIAEELHSAAAFWLGQNGGMSEDDRALARARSRAQGGMDKGVGSNGDA